MKRLIIFLAAVMSLNLASAQVGVGQWRDYLSYGHVHRVEVSASKVYAAARMGIMCYDRESQMLTRMNKTTGLSDAGIATIAYNEAKDYLVVAYTNSNIDLVHDDVVYNISDIRRSDIPGDKSVYHVKFRGQYAYLACGFGLVVIDLSRKEIKETYYLGEHGSFAPVYDVAFDEVHIYAATAEGVLKADASSNFLNIVDNWSLSGSVLDGRHVTMLEMSNGYVAAAAATYDPMVQELYMGSRMDDLSKIDAGDVMSIRLGDKLLASYANQVKAYWPTGGIAYILASFAYGDMQPMDAVLDKSGHIWVGHDWGGLIEFDQNDSKYQNVYSIQGPATDDVYRITPYRSRIFVAPGGKKATNESLYHFANVYTFEKDRWQQLNRDGYRDGLFDVVDVAVDPKDSTHQLAVAWGSAILELRNNQIVAIYDENNTQGLTAYIDGSFRSLRVGAVAFDEEGNAWVTNSRAANGLLEYTREGEWKALNTQAVITNPDMEIDRVLCDSINGYKWVIGRANRIFVFDGKGGSSFVDPNQGSKLETHSVNCIVQDHDGEIWFGTDKGIKVIYDGYKAMSNDGAGERAPVNCSNILFSEDGVDEYLMAYENVTNIAVDGANRKWVGTANNGLYLISENGQEQLRHFTAANSSLFSDKIVALAIQPRTGEVLVGTDKGLQSFRSTATYASYYNDPDVHAFPNPVRPDYEGMVAIKGFSRNALVHITDVAGHVVYSCTADGGQAVWNLRTLSGEKVSSGVYYVLGSDINGQMRVATKILVVR